MGNGKLEECCMTTALWIIGAFIAGGGIGWFVTMRYFSAQQHTAREIADELFRESEQQRNAALASFADTVKAQFGDISLEALGKSSEQILKLAGERFDSQSKANNTALTEKKGLIDQQLERMTKELEKVTTMVKEFEKDREGKFGALDQQLRTSMIQTGELIKTTTTLREALAGTKSRGQWGERMAEDVLRVAGFHEGINYLKQTAMETGRTIPDFTFLMPRDRRLSMDVKFPYDNYVKFLDADNDTERERFRKDFIGDVKNHIKEIAGRGYTDGDNVVDYTIMFIPNERIFAFIHDQAPGILDFGIEKKVLICSPVTLFAVLAVVRTAVRNFELEQTSGRILGVLSGVRGQWTEFVKVLDKLGKQLGTVHNTFDELGGRRKRMIEKKLDAVDQLREERKIEGGDNLALLPEDEE